MSAAQPADPDGPANGDRRREAAAPALAIQTRGLSKTYRASRHGPASEALKGIDLEIPRGSFFGLLGPNGAGKSTLINILAGIVTKTAGEALVWGHDIEAEMRAARMAIGVVPQELNIDAFFTPRALLELQAGLYGVPKRARRTDEILESLALTDKAEAHARTLSGGMRRRLLVAKAMVHEPPVLVLDEPTAGVDVELRRQLWAAFKDLNARGTTILLTTHYLEEAQRLCDTIAIIDHGEVVARDSTEALLRRVDHKEIAITTAEAVTDPPAAPPGVSVELSHPRRLVFRYRPSRTRIPDILEAVRAAGYGIADLTTEETDLEDIFLELTGRTADEAAAETQRRQA